MVASGASRWPSKESSNSPTSEKACRPPQKRGYTQAELAHELGVTQRMVSYYEGHSEYPPASLLPRMAKLLNVTADELLGLKPLKATRQPDTRLLRRLQQIEKLSTAKGRQIIQVIDTFIENNSSNRTPKTAQSRPRPYRRSPARSRQGTPSPVRISDSPNAFAVRTLLLCPYGL
jgi:transcriptional regulator with XRE-family HTH domain